MTKAMEAIVTGTAAAIVTVLADAPATALDLSPRVANIRQTLRRMAAAGVVTRLRRGVYALGCDTITEGSATAKPAWAGPPPMRAYTDAEITAAVAGAWAHFERQNDVYCDEAWA